MYRKILIFLITFFILTTVGIGADKIKPIKITIISNNCYSSMKYANFEYQVHNAVKENEKISVIKEYYLDCYGSCNELEVRDRFFHVWPRIKAEKPDYLIIFGAILFKTFLPEIIELSEHTKIGVFDVFLDNDIRNRIKFFKGKMDNIFIEEYMMNVPLMINFFRSNAKDFKNFYIIRDSCPQHLILSSYITKELKKINFDFKVKTYEVRTRQQLKTTLVLLQNEPTGILIPFMNDVSLGQDDFLNINNILKIVDKTNFKHIELSMNRDASAFLALSFAHNLTFINKNYDSNSAVEEFLINFKGDGLKEYVDESYFIVNQDKLRETLNGSQLLKHTSDYIQIFR